MKRGTRRAATAGDRLVVEAHRVGGGRRLGEIVEVLGEGTHEHYRVRWDDERESIFYPDSSDATIRRRSRTRPAPPPAPEPAEADYDEPVLTHEP